MHKSVVIFISVFSFFLQSTAQQQLTVGDVMPDVKNIRFLKDGKYSIINVDFSAGDERLVIFDFWGTTCAPCISQLPKMDSIQKKFGNKLLILPIVRVESQQEGEKYISDFWQKNFYTKKCNSLGTLLETEADPKLYKSFPNAGMPWMVWVKNGKIIAQTSKEYVNEREIGDVLAGVKKSWAVALGRVSNDDTRYDYSFPLFFHLAQQGMTSYSNKFVYSTLGGYLTSKYPNERVKFAEGNTGVNKLTIINASICDLYRCAISRYMSNDHFRKEMAFACRNILEVKDISKYKKPENIYELEWRKEYSYSYELVLPPFYLIEEVFEFMRQDLNKYFKLNGRMERRKVNCWIITRNANPIRFDQGLEKKMQEERDKLIAKMGIDTWDSERAATDYKRGWKEVLISSADMLADVLNGNSEKGNSENAPVLDESNFTGELSLLIRVGNNISFQEYRNQLVKNGFDLKKEERELDMCVISEK